MKLIVSCLVSIMLLFNVSLALPNANNLFLNTDDEFINAIDGSLGAPLNALLLLLYKVGYTLAVAIAVILAIKLMFTTPAKKAEVKAAFTPYFIGLLLVIVGVPIATKVIEFFTILL